MNSIITVISIMFFSGAAGGYANYLLSASVAELKINGKPEANRLRWWGYIFVGVVAAFIVPLFLSLVQSSLLENISSSDERERGKFFVFIGICLSAAISSRSFIQTVSSKMLALLKEQEKDVARMEERQQAQDVNLEEIAENVVPEEAGQPAESEQLTTGIETKVPLSSDERRVLEVLQAKPYTRRTLKGISTDAKMQPDITLTLLGGLMERDLVREIQSKKTGSPLYKLTARGANQLSL
jgi:hypothetical protein